jgi:hypothetical protein
MIAAPSPVGRVRRAAILRRSDSRRARLRIDWWWAALLAVIALYLAALVIVAIYGISSALGG